MLLPIISLSVCVLATVVFILVSLLKGGKWGLITKIFASLCFVVAGLLAVLNMYETFDPNTAISPTWAWFVFTGLVMGLVGDIFMDLKEKELPAHDVFLNTGMLSFGIGHFMYFAGLTLCVTLRCHFLIPTAIAIVIGAVITLLIFLNAGSLGIKWGKFKWQSFTYSLVLTIMFVYAVAIAVLDKNMWMFAVGMALFLLSDLILSLIYFAGKKTNTMRALNWSTYYLAQQTLVLFMFLI